MGYKIEFSEFALKTIKKLDSTARKQILKYISQVLLRVDDPHLLGKALTGNFGGFWRYRTGHFRIICKIYDEQMIVLILRVAHRKNAYEE